MGEDLRLEEGDIAIKFLEKVFVVVSHRCQALWSVVGCRGRSSVAHGQSLLWSVIVMTAIITLPAMGPAPPIAEGTVSVEPAGWG